MCVPWILEDKFILWSRFPSRDKTQVVKLDHGKNLYLSHPAKLAKQKFEENTLFVLSELNSSTQCILTISTPSFLLPAYPWVPSVPVCSLVFKINIFLQLKNNPLSTTSSVHMHISARLSSEPWVPYLYSHSQRKVILSISSYQLILAPQLGMRSLKHSLILPGVLNHFISFRTSAHNHHHHCYEFMTATTMPC